MKRSLRLGIGIGIVALFVTGYFVTTNAGQDRMLQWMATAGMAQEFPPPIDGLRVFMCGTSSPLPAPDRDQTCVIVIVGERMYLVDAGAGSARAATLGRHPMEELRMVLLTHFHSDHIASLYDFNLLSWVTGRPGHSPLEERSSKWS